MRLSELRVLAAGSLITISMICEIGVVYRYVCMHVIEARFHLHSSTPSSLNIARINIRNNTLANDIKMWHSGTLCAPADAWDCYVRHCF